MFEGLMTGNNDSNPVKVLEKLLDPNNVEMITDLNITQIQVLCQLKWFISANRLENKGKDLELLDEILTYYLTLMVSVGRKSREEIIKGISEMKEALFQQESLLNNIRSNK